MRSSKANLDEPLHVRMDPASPHDEESPSLALGASPDGGTSPSDAFHPQVKREQPASETKRG